MPQVIAERTVRLDPSTAFELSQTTGAFRLRWDPFIHSQQFQDGATVAAKGVRTRTRSRMGLLMISEYVSFVPGKNVGMKMVAGPWFFANFGAGWRFAESDGGTRLVWKYTFTCKPRFLQPWANPVGQWLLGREIERRISSFAAACDDPQLIADLGFSG
ncbi:SRPBCC family protein [Arthrobacter sp. HLT1-20]